MAMCFALGITSFAVEPPTIHQTMMELSPGYEPLAWSGWIGPYVVRDSLHGVIRSASDVVTMLADIYDYLTFTPQDLIEMTLEDVLEEYADDLWSDLEMRLLLQSIDNVYFRATHKWRYNEATSQIQHNVMIELYADEDYYDLIDVFINTATYYQNLNRSI